MDTKKKILTIFAALFLTSTVYGEVKLSAIAESELGIDKSCVELYVSPRGNDSNPGTKAKPLASIEQARDLIRTMPQRMQQPISVILREGVYYLDDTLVFTAEDSGAENAAIDYRSAKGELAILSGGSALTGLNWMPYQDGIMQAEVPQGFATDQLFVNSKQMPMARYPNFDSKAKYFNGTAEDAFSKERAARWKNPAGGFMHVLHNARWGGMHYTITGKETDGSLLAEGGWQNNRGSRKHPSIRFVENIFEELDAPGEWFLNQQENKLYFMPPVDLDLDAAKFESVRLRHLVEFQGNENKPVQFLTMKDLTFRHAARTFMDNKERMLRTDWTVYRGAAILMKGTEDCLLENCSVNQVGGNAIFADSYNRRITLKGCHVSEVGGNGIAFVGDQKAVHNGLVGYGSRAKFDEISKQPGPKTNNYPADSLVEECLIHDTGQVEKQTAGVEIDMAMHITVRHCSIYDLPRAGINIGDGCWGGHVIEFCDVFDTVMETGDHGAFNSWGRDRFWGLTGIDLNTITLGDNANLPLLDVIHPNILRNNRWRCDHGWDIDLDDGSSNYQIRNNLCLNGGIKNREGFYRTVENNIMVNDGFHPHVWYNHCGDVFQRNIMFEAYKPRIMKEGPWGKTLDYNLLHSETESGKALVLSEASGRDEHSLIGNAQFLDPTNGDYRVAEDSIAIQLGFVNFPMNQFGVKSPRLRKLARKPQLPTQNANSKQPTGNQSEAKQEEVLWFGAMIRNIQGLGDVSAAGLPSETGVLLVKVPTDSPASKAGLKVGDVILKCTEKKIDKVNDLQGAWKKASSSVSLEIWREQKSVRLEVEITK